MADIDATDNHMGRTAEGTYPVKRHMFVGPTKQVAATIVAHCAYTTITEALTTM
jgi:hypothetical protein